jgi:hypothetical protein
MNLSTPETQPAASKGPAIWPMVIKDMCDRHEAGCAKYATPLRAHNGRRPLIDAYQELLDLAVYLRQEIVEREQLQAELGLLRQQIELQRLAIATYESFSLGTVAPETTRAAATLMPNIATDDEEWSPAESADDPDPLDGQEIDHQLRCALQVEETILTMGDLCRSRRDQAVRGVNA